MYKDCWRNSSKGSFGSAWSFVLEQPLSRHKQGSKLLKFKELIKNTKKAMNGIPLWKGNEKELQIFLF